MITPNKVPARVDGDAAHSLAIVSARRRIVAACAPIAICVWVTILAVVCVRAGLHPDRNSVYMEYHNGAIRLLAKEQLYNNRNTTFRYSPTVAVFFIPFAQLPERFGGVVWRLLCGVVYCGGLAWCCRIGLPRIAMRRIWPLVFLLVIPLSIGSLNIGQANAMMAGLLLVATAAAAQRRWTLAAVGAAGAALYKIYPVVVGMLFGLLFSKKFLPRFLIALLVGASIPFLFWRWDYMFDQHRSWIRFVVSANRQLPDLGKWFQDIRLVCRVWFVPLSPHAYSAIQLVVGGMIAAMCGVGRVVGVPPRRLIILSLGLGGCWMTAFGSAAELNTYILIAPSMAWAVIDAWWIRRDAVSRAIMSLAYTLTLVAQAAMWFPFGKRFGTYGIQVFAALLLFAYLLLDLGREIIRARRKRNLQRRASGVFPDRPSPVVVGALFP